MIILAADTSTALGSVAIRDHEGKVLREDLDRSEPHSRTLLPAVEKILDRAGLTRRDVEAIGVGVGPGGFTGLRVGLATFKAWAAASGLPLVPVVSMDAVAFPVLRKGGSVVVLADARKGEVFAAFYPSLTKESLPRRQGDIVLIPHEGVREWLQSLGEPGVTPLGTALPLLADRGILDDLPCEAEPSGAPDARYILALAEVLLALRRTVKPRDLIPHYIRPPDASKPSPGTMITGSPDEDRCSEGS